MVFFLWRKVIKYLFAQALGDPELVAVFVFGQYFDSLNKLGCQSWYSWVHKKTANLKAVYKLRSPSVDPNAMPLNRVRQRGGQHIS